MPKITTPLTAIWFKIRSVYKLSGHIRTRQGRTVRVCGHCKINQKYHQLFHARELSPTYCVQSAAFCVPHGAINTGSGIALAIYKPGRQSIRVVRPAAAYGQGYSLCRELTGQFGLARESVHYPQLRRTERPVKLHQMAVAYKARLPVWRRYRECGLRPRRHALSRHGDSKGRRQIGRAHV